MTEDQDRTSLEIQKLRPSGQFSKALLLATYFFLIICGYYFVKPLSRSLYITYLGTDKLPYVWVVTVTVLAIVVPLFHHLSKTISASAIVRATTLAFIALLLTFLAVLGTPSAWVAFAFYIAVDVFSVILVEVFWSITNSSYELKSGKGWYGLVASGGLFGGMAGSAASSFCLDTFELAPVDLIYPSTIILLLALILVLMLFGRGLIADKMSHATLTKETLKQFYSRLVASREARLIVLILCFSQLIEPLVEYQFLASVERHSNDLGERTAIVSTVLAWVSGFGLLVSLCLVPLLHIFFGTLGGLVMQPTLIGVFSILALLKGSIFMSSALKIADRGLAYSTGRASRELLYVKLDGDTNFRLKAWVDVLGYRLFRIVGALTVLFATYVGGAGLTTSSFVIVITLTLSILWFRILMVFRPAE